MHETYIDDNTPVQSPRRWTIALAWLAAIAASYLIFVISSDLGLGLAAISLRFGWSDFQTARWLRRRDPYRQRGVANFWLYASSGSWKAAQVAAVGQVIFFSTLVVNPTEGFKKPFNPDNRNERLETPLEKQLQKTTPICLVFATGFVVCAVLASWHSSCKGPKLRLNKAVHQARKADVWPPAIGESNKANQLFFLAKTYAIVFGVLVAGLKKEMFPDDDTAQWLGSLSLASLISVSGLLYLLFHFWLKNADLPAKLSPVDYTRDCWLQTPPNDDKPFLEDS